MKRMFDKFRQPLKITEGDYVYIYYPKINALPKLHPKAFGPFQVLRVVRMHGTMDPVGVIVNLGTHEDPIPRRFPRARVHPYRYLHRDMNWNQFTQRANDMHNGPRVRLTNHEQVVLDSVTGLPTYRESNVGSALQLLKVLRKSDDKFYL